MEQSNVQRIKNIIDGNYTAKSVISTGYQKEEIQHVEGEFFEENGKTYMIKNGIKRSYSKLSKIRHETKTPLTCPKCNRAMTKWQDSKTWEKFRMCLDCLVEEDNQRIIDGTFDQYAKDKRNKNISAWLTDIEVACLEVVESIDANHFVTEMGDVEKWDKTFDKDKLRESVVNQVAELKDKLKND